jgi:valyl-tRNA synthetase
VRDEELQQRLERETGKLEAETAKLDKKLANEQFLPKAPEAVIEEQRARRQELVEKLEKIKAALERLKGG